MILLFIALGGFAGAILRYAISKKINKSLPYGTFLVNMIGSFLLGFLFYKGMSETEYAFLGSGFCGAFTTFSTFKLEAFQLNITKGKIISSIYLFLSYMGGIICVFFGYLFASQ
jgi:fluoride exporter